MREHNRYVVICCALLALVLIVSVCREEPEKPADPPSESEATAVSEPSPDPAPDLGAELFPDPLGRPIAQASDAPVIVLPRTDWTSSHPDLASLRVMDGVHRITVHHTAASASTDAWKPVATELENIREFHNRQWADIGYHFIIDRAGRVWQARPLAYQGAHVKKQNAHNCGIVLLGNFETQSPSAAQLTALRNFVGFLRQLYEIPLENVHTHRELGATSCPGKNLQAFMVRTRSKWAAEENEKKFE